MAIIRDDKGNIYNIPDQELKQYLTVKTTKAHPEKLCLDPKFDAVRGPHDGWAYVTPSAMPRAAKAARKAAKKTAKKAAKKTVKKAAKKTAKKPKA